MLAISMVLLVGAGRAAAQSPAPEIAARAWLLVDVTTHTVLYSQLPDERVEPASLTKLMTAYLVFNALKEKRLSLDARPPVSQAAYKAIGSRMFIDPRMPATVDELLHGLIIQSGNDAAIVLAETIGGSEAQFAEIMNAEGKRIGMTNSRFTNASGLPDPNHYSTAKDLATLAAIAVAIAGVVLASGPEMKEGLGARPVLLACLAAVGFGVALFALDRGARVSLLHTLWGMRITSAIGYAALALAARSLGGVARRHGPRRGG